jgi:hypothetical protein
MSSAGDRRRRIAFESALGGGRLARLPTERSIAECWVEIPAHRQLIAQNSMYSIPGCCQRHLSGCTRGDGVDGREENTGRDR